MEYPVNCITSADKTEYLYRAEELLRELHNKFVTWRDDGLTQEEYDLFPAGIRAAFPYEPQIVDATWERMLNEEFLPRSEKLQEEILVQRAAFKISTRWTIDVGKVEKFVRT